MGASGLESRVLQPGTQAFTSPGGCDSRDPKTVFVTE